MRLLFERLLRFAIVAFHDTRVTPLRESEPRERNRESARSEALLCGTSTRFWALCWISRLRPFTLSLSCICRQAKPAGDGDAASQSGQAGFIHQIQQDFPRTPSPMLSELAPTQAVNHQQQRSTTPPAAAAAAAYQAPPQGPGEIFSV